MTNLVGERNDILISKQYFENPRQLYCQHHSWLCTLPIKSLTTPMKKVARSVVWFKDGSSWRLFHDSVTWTKQKTYEHCSIDIKVTCFTDMLKLSPNCRSIKRLVSKKSKKNLMIILLSPTARTTFFLLFFYRKSPFYSHAYVNTRKT